MSLPVRDQLKYWGLATAVFLVVLWYLGNVLMPFLLGGAIAYFLDPVADRLQRMGCSRTVATVIITLGGLLIFILMALLIVPTLVQQTVALVDAAPKLFHKLQTVLTDKFPSLMDSTSVLRQSLESIGKTIQARGGEFINGVLSSAITFLNLLVLIVIVPVVGFYMLMDWDRMIAEIDDLLPRDHAPVIRELAREINHTLASFVRGQGTVGLILGSFYAISLMLVGLQFGLVVGVVSGLITFIPYVGAIVGGVLAIGLGLVQFWGDWMSLGLIAGIFVFGQFVEGNILSPNLVGSSVGLHPVWLMLALSVFGSLFGFVGMLVAVPVAAALGVIARFAARQYRQSQLYKGTDSGGEDG